MAELESGFSTCLNCSNPTKGKHNYRGVIICSNCFAVAQMCDKKAVKQCLDMLTIYRESLRVQLASGQLRPSTRISKEGEKVTPPRKEDLRDLLERFTKSIAKSQGVDS